MHFLDHGRLRPLGDLIFEGSKPLVVNGWHTIGDKRVPELWCALAPERLTPLDRNPGQYLYAVPFRDDEGEQA